MTTIELARIASCSADEVPHESIKARSVSPRMVNTGHVPSTRARLDADNANAPSFWLGLIAALPMLLLVAMLTAIAMRWM